MKKITVNITKEEVANHFGNITEFRKAVVRPFSSKDRFYSKMWVAGKLYGQPHVIFSYISEMVLAHIVKFPDDPVPEKWVNIAKEIKNEYGE